MDFSHDRSGTWSPQTTMFLGVFPEGRELACGSHDCLLAKQYLMFLQYFASSTVIHFTGLGVPSKTSKPIGSCKKETTTKQYGVKATTKQPLNKLFSGAVWSSPRQTCGGNFVLTEVLRTIQWLPWGGSLTDLYGPFSLHSPR